MRKLALAVVLTACGGGSGGGIGGTGPITQAQADEVCRGICEHEVECGTEIDVESCIPSCADDFVGWARADAVQTLANCFTATACGTSDDSCIGLVDPLAIHEEWEAGCRTELAACIDPNQIEEACSVQSDGGEGGLFRFIAPAIMEDIIACLDGADCEARLTCIEQVLDVNGVDF